MAMERIKTSVMSGLAAVAVVLCEGAAAFAQEGETVGAAPEQSKAVPVLLAFLFIALILISSFKPAKRTHLD